MKTAEELRDLIARAMYPEEWAEFDAGNGVCSNNSGWKILESIKLAAAAYRCLYDLSISLPEPARPKKKIKV